MFKESTENQQGKQVEREKMPTESQELILQTMETLTAIEKKLEPISVKVPRADEKKDEADKSQIICALRELVNKAKYIEESLSL